MSDYEDPTGLKDTFPQTLSTQKDINKFLLYEANALFERLLMIASEDLDNLDRDDIEAPF